MTLTKEIRKVIEIASPSPAAQGVGNFVKENQDRKKANFTWQHLRTDFHSMMGEERLSALSLVYIHRDIFLGYDKNNRHLCIQVSKEDAFN